MAPLLKALPLELELEVVVVASISVVAVAAVAVALGGETVVPGATDVTVRVFVVDATLGDVVAPPNEVWTTTGGMT